MNSGKSTHLSISKLYAIAYVVLVVISNLVTIYFKPLNLAGVLIPSSSWFMGFTFLLINLISRYENKRFTGSLIWVGLFLTSLICLAQNLPQSLVVASGVAFWISQQISVILFKKLSNYYQSSWVNSCSSFVGSVIDATIWIALGLSPLGIGTVAYIDIPSAVFGQVVVQFILQTIASKYLKK